MADEQAGVKGGAEAASATVLSDHVKHLRFVHFSLVAACLGLLIVSLAIRGGSESAVTRELDVVKGVVELWLRDRERSTPFGESVDTSVSEQDIDFWVSRSSTVAAEMTLPARRVLHIPANKAALAACRRGVGLSRSNCPHGWEVLIEFGPSWKSTSWGRMLAQLRTGLAELRDDGSGSGSRTRSTSSSPDWSRLVQRGPRGRTVAFRAHRTSFQERNPFGMAPPVGFLPEEKRYDLSTVTGFGSVWDRLQWAGVAQATPEGVARLGAVTSIDWARLRVDDATRDGFDPERHELLAGRAPSAAALKADLIILDFMQDEAALNQGWVWVSGFVTADVPEAFGHFALFHVPVKVVIENFQPARSVLRALISERPDLSYARKYKVPRSEPYFEHVFPALFAFTKNVTSVRLDELDRLIENQRKLQTKPISLFGITAPAALAKAWGPWAIAAVLAYFFSHLHAFARHPASAAVEGPWIALYDAKVPRAMFLGSSTVLPAGTALFLEAGEAILGEVKFAPTWATLISLSIVALLVIAVTSETLALWRRREAGGGQA